MRQTLAALERYNIVKAIVSGPLEVVEQWRTTAPTRILASLKLPSDSLKP